MEGNFVKENLEPIFEKFKDMIKVETVVGEAVKIGDATLVPFVDVTMGFGTGGHNGTGNCGGGGGGAASVAYVATVLTNTTPPPTVDIAEIVEV